MRTRILVAVATGALTLAACSPTEAENTTSRESPANTEAALDEIEQAANEAAAGINAQNADAELEKLKAEMNENK